MTNSRYYEIQSMLADFCQHHNKAIPACFILQDMSNGIMGDGDEEWQGIIDQVLWETRIPSNELRDWAFEDESRAWQKSVEIAWD